MGTNSQRGQIVVELAIVALFFVAFFMFSMSINSSTSSEIKRHRFASPDGSTR